MDYLTIKFIHILSSTLLLGTGLGIAFFMFLAHKSKDVYLIARVSSFVVWADTLFTAPAVVVQLLTGLWLTHLLGIPLSVFWVKTSLLLFFVVGMCWLPVVYLQIKARNLARQSFKNNSPLPKKYDQVMRWWFVLGWPAFIAVVVVFYLMVHKPVSF